MKKWLVCVLAVFAWSCGDEGPVRAPSGGGGNECIPTSGGIELCDGIDNDCNGQVDESFPELGEACSGSGACTGEGTIVCNDDGVGTRCDGVTGEGTPEICDGTDNDCDGEVDEDFEGIGEECSAGEGACANTGIIVCDTEQSTACNAVSGTPGAEELCNGMDDDCDGELDEGFVGVGDACEVGLGACAASGLQACSADGSEVECNAMEGTPSDEICDGIDNDCDGEVDEEFDVGAACTAGLGVCEQSGVIECTAEGAAMCNAVAGTPPTTNETTCDDLDNDCDGEIDEGCDVDSDGFCNEAFTRTGNPAVCPTNQRDCNDNNDQIYPGAAEVCDGLDNNCNNLVDDNPMNGTRYYLDCDGDGYAGDTIDSRNVCSAPDDADAQSICNLTLSKWTTRQPIGADIDCHPRSRDVYPGQTKYFHQAISNPPPTMATPYDYNCDGQNEIGFTDAWNDLLDVAQCPPIPHALATQSCVPPNTVFTFPNGSTLISMWPGPAPGCGSHSGRICFNYQYNASTGDCRAQNVSAGYENIPQVCR